MVIKSREASWQQVDDLEWILYAGPNLNYMPLMRLVKKFQSRKWECTPNEDYYTKICEYEREIIKPEHSLHSAMWQAESFIRRRNGGYF